MPVQPDPLRRIEERLRRQRPALEVEQLLLVAVALQHDVLAASDALDLGQRALEFEDAQIVERGERDNKVELVVAERVGVLGAVVEERSAEVGVRVLGRVLGDVEPRQAQLRYDLLHLVEQKSLAAADVKHAVAGLEGVVVDERLRHGFPASGHVVVTAVAVAAVAVPVVGLVFLGLDHAGDLVVVHSGEVVSLGAGVQRCDDVHHPAHYRSSFVSGGRFSLYSVQRASRFALASCSSL